MKPRSKPLVRHRLKRKEKSGKTTKDETFAFPERVRVGPFVYTIKRLSTDDAQDMERYGDCDRDKNVIRVAEGLAQDRALETFFHEILHAMFEASNLKSDGNIRAHEEVIVNGLSMAMINLMRDEPLLIASLAKEFSKK